MLMSKAQYYYNKDNELVYRVVGNEVRIMYCFNSGYEYSISCFSVTSIINSTNIFEKMEYVDVLDLLLKGEL